MALAYCTSSIYGCVRGMRFTDWLWLGTVIVCILYECYTFQDSSMFCNLTLVQILRTTISVLNWIEILITPTLYLETELT